MWPVRGYFYHGGVMHPRCEYSDRHCVLEEGSAITGVRKERVTWPVNIAVSQQSQGHPRKQATCHPQDPGNNPPHLVYSAFIAERSDLGKPQERPSHSNTSLKVRFIPSRNWAAADYKWQQTPTRKSHPLLKASCFLKHETVWGQQRADVAP